MRAFCARWGGGGEVQPGTSSGLASWVPVFRSRRGPIQEVVVFQAENVRLKTAARWVQTRRATRFILAYYPDIVRDNAYYAPHAETDDVDFRWQL